MWLPPDFCAETYPYAISTIYKRVTDLNRDGFVGTVSGISGAIAGFRNQFFLTKKSDGKLQLYVLLSED